MLDVFCAHNNMAMKTRISLVVASALSTAMPMFAQNIPYYTPAHIDRGENTKSLLEGFRPTLTGQVGDTMLTHRFQRLLEVAWVDSAVLAVALDTTGIPTFAKELVMSNDAKKLFKELRERDSVLTKVVVAYNALRDSLIAAAGKGQVKVAEGMGGNSRDTQRTLQQPTYWRAEYKATRSKVYESFKELQARKIANLTNADSVRKVIDSIRKGLADSLYALAQLRDARIGAYRTLKNQDGMIIIDGSPETTKAFYDPFNANSSKFLQSNILTLNTATGNGSLYSEIFHDYIGPVRIGIGGLLSNAAKTDEADSTAANAGTITEDQAQRILGGGGNTTASFGVPLIGFTSASGTFMFRFFFQPKLALDLTKYKSSTDRTPFHGDLGFELHTSFSGRDGLLSFFGSARPAILIGNPVLYENLQKGDLRSIAMTQVRFGLGINNVLRVSYSVNAGDDFVQRTFPSQLTITLLTDGFKNK